MDTILTVVVQAICAATVIYILFRENFHSTAQELEGRIRAIAPRRKT